MALDEHRCHHESDWAVVKDHVGDMAIDLKAVLKMLRGNGAPGLITRMALLEQTLEKAHERLDVACNTLAQVSDKADQCDRNDAALKSLTKVVWWVLSPTLVVIIAGVVKMSFFGG